MLFPHIHGMLLQAKVGQSNIEYDMVLIGGTVIDSETKLDKVKNVGSLRVG